MDTTVELVQAYLQLNGYFTVTEYPLLELSPHQGRAATDLDVLAFRFPMAGQEIRGPQKRMAAPVIYQPDSVLGAAPDQADMIIGEVKAGRAHFNPAASNPLIVAAGLARFGCCSPDAAKDLARQLIRRGRAETSHGHTVRMVAFGSRTDQATRWHTVAIGHIVQFLTDYLRKHWSELRYADFKNSALSFLALLEKSGFAPEGRRHKPPQIQPEELEDELG